MFFDQSNNFKLEGNSTAGIIEDSQRTEHMGHVAAARWKEVREKVCHNSLSLQFIQHFFCLKF